jgi:predicted Holliday junction resolvase-like endonuclease
MLMSNPIALKFLLENKRRGKLGEKIAQEQYESNGFKIIPIRAGFDFIACKRIEGKLYQEYVEVKTGNSRVSKRQKIVMQKITRRGKKYTVYRITNIMLDNYLGRDASMYTVWEKGNAEKL